MDIDYYHTDGTGSPFLLLQEASNHLHPLDGIEIEAPFSSTEMSLEPTFTDIDSPAEESLLMSSLSLLYELNENEDISSATTQVVIPENDQGIQSLDEVSSTSDLFSVTEELSSSSDSCPGDSITSRLKSVLMTRQKQKHEDNINSTHPLSTINSMHNYINPNGEYPVRHSVNLTNGIVENRPNGSSLKFPPCCVCGGCASGLHYGVNSCEPCKGFFTRYLRKKEEFKCAKYDTCPITSRLRGNCSACRLKKCLALGMSRKNSRLGRYSLARRMETIMQVNKLEGKMVNSCGVEMVHATNGTGVDTCNQSYENKQNTCTTTNSAIRSSSCKVKTANGFSQKLVKCLVSHMDNIKPYGNNLVTKDQVSEKLNAHFESFKLKRELFGNMSTVPNEEYYRLRKEFGIEIDHRMMYLKDSAQDVVDVISRYCTFAKQIPSFTNLSNKDQSNLLKSSRYDFFMILMHEGYHHENQVFLAHSGVAFHREEVADKFFSRRLVLNVCDMYHRLQLLHLSKEERALLVAIALVFTDRCVLENPDIVEQIQFSLTQLLRNQLEKTCRSSASKRFTKIIDCLTVMRESSELYLREYKQLCKDKRVIEEVPIMTAMLFDDI